MEILADPATSIFPAEDWQASELGVPPPEAALGTHAQDVIAQGSLQKREETEAQQEMLKKLGLD